MSRFFSRSAEKGFKVGIPVGAVGSMLIGVDRSIVNFRDLESKVPENKKLIALTKKSAQGFDTFLKGIAYGVCGGGLVTSGFALGIITALAQSQTHNKKLKSLYCLCFIASIAPVSLALSHVSEGVTDMVQVHNSKKSLSF